MHASSGDLNRLIHRVAGEEKVDAGLLRAIVDVESDFKVGLISDKGAGGLMQLMPATARALGVTNRFNAEQSLRGGARYIKRLIDMYPSLPLALAAYNAGPGNVDKFGGMPPFPETRSYVRRVMAKYAKENFSKKPVPLRTPRLKASLNKTRSKEAREKTMALRTRTPALPNVMPLPAATVAQSQPGPEAYGFLHRSSYLAARHAVVSEILDRELITVTASDAAGEGTTEVPIIRLVSN
ncbi:MAG: lytic transglycosylase domain-containing protein [Magnetococcales bacterium]|nr:lytic transglycosylase domain-containing protein [Magnetococcales bacterium]